MRTNIEIDDTLMADAMEAGGFKTKKEAVEEGLRLVRRRKVYDGLLALRGKLQWDDSDAVWALAHAEAPPAMAAQEAKGSYDVETKMPVPLQSAKVKMRAANARSKVK